MCDKIRSDVLYAYVCEELIPEHYRYLISSSALISNLNLPE